MRRLLPERIDLVWRRLIDPGRVFDYETDSDGIPAAYAAMDERRAVKSLVRIGPL